METAQICQMLSELSELCIPSGLEVGAAQSVAPFFPGFDMQSDRLGNLYFRRMSSNTDAPHIIIDAHLDEIALIADTVDERGFVTFVSPFGTDLRCLPGSRVRIFGTQQVDGVVTAQSPHLTAERDKPVEASSLLIDTGGTATAANVRTGDKICHIQQARQLTDRIVTGKALDNRVSVCALALLALDLPDTDVGLTFCLSSGEEIGLFGARSAYGRMECDLGIVLDATYACDKNKGEQGLAVLGWGPMLGIAPILDRPVFTLCKQLSGELNIPYQIEVMNTTTGTNAWVMQGAGGGHKTALISIPIRNMHSAVECVDVTDILHTAKLLKRLIEVYMQQKKEVHA